MSFRSLRMMTASEKELYESCMNDPSMLALLKREYEFLRFKANGDKKTLVSAQAAMGKDNSYLVLDALEFFFGSGPLQAFAGYNGISEVDRAKRCLQWLIVWYILLDEALKKMDRSLSDGGFTAGPYKDIAYVGMQGSARFICSDKKRELQVAINLRNPYYVDCEAAFKKANWAGSVSDTSDPNGGTKYIEGNVRDLLPALEGALENF